MPTMLSLLAVLVNYALVALRVPLTKAIIMMVVCTGTMKINFFTKDPQVLAGGMGII